MTFATLAILAASLSSPNAEEPPVFRIFNISTEEVDHYPQGRSECLKWDDDRVFCPTGWKLGNARMESISFMYVRGRLSEVRGLAKNGEFRLMIETLKMKYGEPKGTPQEPTWFFRGGKLVARQIVPQFSSNLADSEFHFISKVNAEVPSREPVVNF